MRNHLLFACIVGALLLPFASATYYQTSWGQPQLGYGSQQYAGYNDRYNTYQAYNNYQNPYARNREAPGSYYNNLHYGLERYVYPPPYRPFNPYYRTYGSYGYRGYYPTGLEWDGHYRIFY